MLKFTSIVGYTSCGPTYIESFLTIFGQCINVLNYKYIYICKRSIHIVIDFFYSFKTNLIQNPLDGSWHHLAVVWHSPSNMWELHIDGAFIGEWYKQSWGSKYIIDGGDLLIGQNLHPVKNWN